MDNVFPDHGANREWAAFRYGIEPGAFIDFSSNVNPLGPPDVALTAAGTALDAMHEYPEPNGRRLKEAIAGGLYKGTGIGAESVMVGNGSTELIYTLCRCLNTKKVLVVNPAFSEYGKAARAAGCDVSCFNLDPSDCFVLESEKLASEAAAADLVFFCNPASPTGVEYESRLLLPVIDICRGSGTTVVVDESYMGFLSPFGIERCSLAAAENIAKGCGSLIVVSTLTKLYALAGLRGPGYLVADPSVVRRLENASPPWRVNVAAVAAAIAAIGDAVYLNRTRESVGLWRDELQAGLDKSGILKTFPSSVNFLLACACKGMGGERITESLGRRGLLVRNCWNFRPLDGNFLRIAVLKPESNRKLLKALDEIEVDVGS